MERRSSSNVYNVRKFDGKNYKMWAFEMEMLLSREQAWTIVDGSEPSPLRLEVEKDGKAVQSTASREVLDYKWRYFEALRLIFSALEDSLKLRYMHIKDPAELWRTIKRDYVGELQKPQIWIRRELYEVKLVDHGSVDAYAMRIQNLIDDYRAGATEPEDKISDTEHVFFLLNGIPRSDEWDVEVRLLNDQMGTLAKDPQTVIKKLRAREDAIKSDKGISAEVALYTKDGALAKASQAGKGASGKKKGSGSDKKAPGRHSKDKTCFVCGKAGHMKWNCPDGSGEQKDRHKKGTVPKNASTANVVTTTTPTTVTETLWMTAAEPRVNPTRDIFLDSACTRHVINRRDLFVRYLPLKEGVCKVQGFNESVAYVKGVGNIRVPMRVPGEVNWVTFRNVLHVEESANLISQGQLMRLGVHFEVNGYGTNIYDPKTGRLLASAPLIGLMQPFDIAWEALEESGSSAAAQMTMVDAFKTTAKETGGAELRLWHRRFAHLEPVNSTPPEERRNLMTTNSRRNSRRKR
jgi:hypothetical protein